MRNLIRSRLADGEIELLRASLLRGAPAKEAFTAWRPYLDWENISRSWQRMIPLLQHNLVQQGIDDPLINRFRGVRRYFWLRNLKQMHLAQQVFACFENSGVPALALKGMSIVACHFADRSLRPMEDIDILVPFDRVGQVTDALVGLGAEPVGLRPRSVPAVAASGEFAGWPFRNAQGDYFDLHWCALHLDRRKSFDKDLWQSARRVSVDGSFVSVMSSADQVIHACAHAAQDDGHSTLRAVADCAIILGSGSVDRERLFRRADFHRLRPVVNDMLETLVADIGMEEPAWMKSRPRQARLQRLDLELIKKGTSKGDSGILGLLGAAARLRRGDDDLFGRLLPRSFLRVFANGRKGLVSAIGSRLYNHWGRPRHRRAQLAPDRALKVPAADLLPVSTDKVDAIADSVAPAFIRGWSIDEPSGRWTEGHEAVLAWRQPRPLEHGLRLRLRRAPLEIGSDPVRVEIFANDHSIGAFESGTEAQPTSRIPSSSRGKLRPKMRS